MQGISTGQYVIICAMMFLEYAIWGAWMPVLAARLLGPLKMTGKQTGWIYSTLTLACIVSPLVAGQLADKKFDAIYILAAAHLVGAVMLFVAAKQKSFAGNFVVMLIYSLFYAATLPLVNAVLFRHVADPAAQGWVFFWAPVAWALVGYSLTGWRMKFGVGEGNDCLIYAGLLSIIMVVVCAISPATPPIPAKEGATPLLDAFKMLKDSDYLVFIVASVVIAGLQMFYFQGSAQFMIDRGISAKAVPATMAIAQAAQAIATTFALGAVLGALGYKMTLTTGAACWAALYAIYVAGGPRGLIIGGQMLHGLAYVTFMIVGQKYVATVAPKEIGGSAQALIFAATNGVGLFLGAQLTGIVMDKFSVNGKFNWAKIWSVPLVIMIIGALVMAFVFKGVVPGK